MTTVVVNIRAGSSYTVSVGRAVLSRPLPASTWIQRTVAQDGVVKEAQPFVDAAVAGDGEAGPAVAFDDQFIEVLALLSREAVQAKVVQDQQVRAQVAAERLVHGMVGARLAEVFQQRVGAHKQHGVASADGGGPQGLRQQSLAHPHRAPEDDVFPSAAGTPA